MLPSGSLVSRKFSMRMSASGCKARAMRPEMRIQLDADEVHARRVPCAMKVARAAARLQHSVASADAEPVERLVHGDDHGRRGVEGVEGGAFGRVVFRGREQGFELLAERLPAGVLVAAGDRVGKERQRHGAEAAETGQDLPFVVVAGRCSARSVAACGSRRGCRGPWLSRRWHGPVGGSASRRPRPRAEEEVTVERDRHGREKPWIPAFAAETDSLRAIEVFSARPDKFDLIITDYTMPNLTGMDLLEEVRRIRPDIPIILCTGFSERITPDSAKELV